MVIYQMEILSGPWMLIATIILVKPNNYANRSKPTSNTRYQGLDTEASYLQAN